MNTILIIARRVTPTFKCTTVHRKSVQLRACSTAAATWKGNYLNYVKFDNPDRPAIYTKSKEKMTYRQFQDRVGMLSGNLVSSFGIRRQSVVAAQVHKSIDNLCLFAAVLNLGAIYVPLNTAYTKTELDYLLRDCRPDLFVYEPTLIHETDSVQVPNGGAKNAVESDVLYAGGHSIDRCPVEYPAKVDTQDAAIICYTSGTTGKPKGAVISHGNITSNGLALGEAWRFSSNDRLLHLLPLYHVHGLLVATSPALFSGASIIFHDKFDPMVICQDLPHATVVMGVPTHYTRLLDCEGFNKDTCRNLRLLTCGSAPLRPDTFDAIWQKTGLCPLERYGMTEAQMICTNPYEGARKAGTVGKAVPGYEVRIRDGVLECRGPGVFRSYLNQPEKTAAAFSKDGFFITGDNASFDEDDYVKITGRTSDMIISGGLNIYPKEIEAVLDSVDHVIESAVIGRLHPDFGETPIAVVHHDGMLQVEALAAKVRESLAGFKRPTDYILSTDSLPRNSMGKIQKNVLREMYSKS